MGNWKSMDSPMSVSSSNIAALQSLDSCFRLCNAVIRAMRAMAIDPRQTVAIHGDGSRVCRTATCSHAGYSPASHSTGHTGQSGLAATPGPAQQAYLDCRQRMTRAEPGGTSEHRLLRSSAHASPSRTLKRMSSAPRCITRCTAALHAGARSSSLQTQMKTHQNDTTRASQRQTAGASDCMMRCNCSVACQRLQLLPARWHPRAP